MPKMTERWFLSIFDDRLPSFKLHTKLELKVVIGLGTKPESTGTNLETALHHFRHIVRCPNSLVYLGPPNLQA